MQEPDDRPISCPCVASFQHPGAAVDLSGLAFRRSGHASHGAFTSLCRRRPRRVLERASAQGAIHPPGRPPRVFWMAGSLWLSHPHASSRGQVLARTGHFILIATRRGSRVEEDDLSGIVGFGRRGGLDRPRASNPLGHKALRRGSALPAFPLLIAVRLAETLPLGYTGACDPVRSAVAVGSPRHHVPSLVRPWFGDRS